MLDCYSQSPYSGNQVIRALTAVAVMSLLGACATAPHTYSPPDSAKLRASTQRVSKAVDQAHTSARKAQGAVSEASKRAKEIREETAKLKEVPVTLIEKINALDSKLDEAATAQADLEKNLKEADLAKAQVEKDKADYFTAAQKVADSATEERNKRIKAEKSLSWYRWHSWLLRIGTALVVIAIGAIAFLWFTGRLALVAGRVASKIP